ncbi:hypothetical protein B4096_3003 [Heyndrickxia coagulans]|uniref:Uncharacterized protein n=1 Tax=Heyndrickxia coagulans TaxID=1398 RepID=A0A133KYY5_HEYCO|nr:hypothetical protein HMPREF3213_00828 [Heyndrickxia coagulans]KYC92047.1 hypothetical protein B4096_3003 [Heyndrickxia coagulans]
MPNPAWASDQQIVPQQRKPMAQTHLCSFSRPVKGSILLTVPQFVE